MWHTLSWKVSDIHCVAMYLTHTVLLQASLQIAEEENQMDMDRKTREIEKKKSTVEEQEMRIAELKKELQDNETDSLETGMQRANARSKREFTT